VENRGRGQKWGGGGPAVRTPCDAKRVWGLTLTGRQRLDRVPADRGTRRRRCSVSGRGAPGAADAWAPVRSGRGREERGVGGAWAGLEEKGLDQARRNSDDFYF
jgi:hypothetical protein